MKHSIEIVNLFRMSAARVVAETPLPTRVPKVNVH